MKLTALGWRLTLSAISCAACFGCSADGAMLWRPAIAGGSPPPLAANRRC
jgi:hypothetical protein